MRLTQALTRDVEKMFRLMRFNVRIGNKDDHSKNFSFVMDEAGEWKLSPAYDLTPSEGINGEFGTNRFLLFADSGRQRLFVFNNLLILLG